MTVPFFLYTDVPEYFPLFGQYFNLFKEYKQSLLAFPHFRLMSVLFTWWNEEAVTSLKLKDTGAKINREAPFQYVPYMAFRTPILFIQGLAELDKPDLPIILDMGFTPDTRRWTLPAQ